MTCWDCEDRPSRRYGLCEICAQRQRRHGLVGPFRLCGNCKLQAVFSRDRCSNCYEYRRDNGIERPSHLWAHLCRRCARPRKVGAWRKGHCPACYEYRRRTGRARPREVIERHAPLGWCECSRPAVEVVEVTIARRTTARIALCEECLDIEERMSA